MKKGIFGVALAAAMTCGLGGKASAASVTVDFPGAGTDFIANFGHGVIPAGGQSGFLYRPGDKVYTTVLTGLDSVNNFSSTFLFQNYLNTTQVYDVTINGIAVGQFSLTGVGSTGAVDTFTFNSKTFAPIVNNSAYALAFILDNPPPAGVGSVAFLDGGIATLTGDLGVVPLPASAPLFGLGLFVLCAARHAGRRFGTA